MKGAESIREKVAELELSGAKVDISEGSLDAQFSENNGLIVVVTGLFDGKPFIHTFFLSISAKVSSKIKIQFLLLGGKKSDICYY